MESDPIGMEGGVNLYAYAGNNSINLIDLYGLEVQLCYSPLSGLEKSFWGTIFTHASVKARCGTFGFHPQNNTFRNFLLGPGAVKNDSARSGLSCIDARMTKCVDESCVCNKIQTSRANPPFYGIVTYNCHSWAHQILSGCQKKCCQK